jgi:hypothetical protein
MRVLVVGRRLAAARGGHEVTAIERRDAAAPGHASAWASPETARTLLKSLILKDHQLLTWASGSLPAR